MESLFSQESFSGIRHPETEKAQKYALLNVFDASGIVGFARGLDSLGYRILVTQNTTRILTDENISFEQVDRLSLPIMGGILYDRNDPRQQEEAKKLGFRPINVVACSLPPLFPTSKDSDLKIDQSLGEIEIDVFVALRAAAKNHQHVLPIVDPTDYDEVVDALRNNRDNILLRRGLALKVFRYFAEYHSLIARQLKIARI